MTRATYNATDCTLTEECEMQKPRPPQDGIFSQYWDIHLKRMAAYEKEVAKCRTIPCSPECRGLWKPGQEVVEGKDYEVRPDDVGGFGEFKPILIAFPLLEKGADAKT